MRFDFQTQSKLHVTSDLLLFEPSPILDMTADDFLAKFVEEISADGTERTLRDILPL